MGGRWLPCLGALLDQAGTSCHRTPAPTPAHIGPLQRPLPHLPGPCPSCCLPCTPTCQAPGPLPFSLLLPTSVLRLSANPAHQASLGLQPLCPPNLCFPSLPTYLAPYLSGSPTPLCPSSIPTLPPLSPPHLVILPPWYPDTSPSSILPPYPSSSPLPGCHGWLTPA